MTLTFKIVAHEIGETFTDGMPRVRAKCIEADPPFGELRFRVSSLDSLPLGAQIAFSHDEAEATVTAFRNK